MGEQLYKHDRVDFIGEESGVVASNLNYVVTVRKVRTASGREGWMGTMYTKSPVSDQIGSMMSSTDVWTERSDAVTQGKKTIDGWGE